VTKDEKKAKDKDEEEFDRINIEDCPLQFDGAPEFQWRSGSSLVPSL